MLGVFLFVKMQRPSILTVFHLFLYYVSPLINVFCLFFCFFFHFLRNSDEVTVSVPTRSYIMLGDGLDWGVGEEFHSMLVTCTSTLCTAGGQCWQGRQTTLDNKVHFHFYLKQGGGNYFKATGSIFVIISLFFFKFNLTWTNQKLWKGHCVYIRGNV